MVATHRCPRPESYTDTDRLRVHGRKLSHAKGCGANSCGFCGPRLADDWARAITATQPSHRISLPISPNLSWSPLRKRVNRLTLKFLEFILPPRFVVLLKFVQLFPEVLKL